LNDTDQNPFAVAFLAAGLAAFLDVVALAGFFAVALAGFLAVTLAAGLDAFLTVALAFGWVAFLVLLVAAALAAGAFLAFVGMVICPYKYSDLAVILWPLATARRSYQISILNATKNTSFQRSGCNYCGLAYKGHRNIQIKIEWALAVAILVECGTLPLVILR